MTTARDIINSAARKMQVLGRGRDLPAEDAQNGLDILNDILASVSAENDMIFNEVREEFALTGAQSYTIGTGGDFDTIKPWSIESAYVSVGDIDYPLKNYGLRAYDEVAFKQITGIPEYYRYDNNDPLGTLYFYPIGDASYRLTMTSLKPLSEFTTLDTDYNMPALYRRYLKHKLAVEWAPEYEREATPTVKKAAIAAEKNIKKYNEKNKAQIVKMDVALLPRKRTNIYTGGYR